MDIIGERRARGVRWSWLPIALVVLSVTLGAGTARVAYARVDGEPGAAQAQIPDTPAGEHLGWFLRAIAETNPPSAEEFEKRFTPEFLEQVPTTQMIATVKGIRMQLGSVVLEKIDEHSPTALTATIFAPKIDQPLALDIATTPDEPHQITGFLMRPLPRRVKEGETWDAIDESLAAVASEVSIGAYRLRESGALQPVHMLNESERLATGSAFKLWVLAALADEVKAGRLKFDDTLAVREEWKSLPGGTMQDEPAGTEHPLSHYADKMISISDNTATDHLIHVIGREKVEAAMARWCAEPARNRPFMTTRDLFALKLNTDDALVERYLAGDEGERRAIIEEELPKVEPNLAMASFWMAPRMIDTLEWFASAEELCQTMADLAALGSSDESMAPVLGALSINPGVALDRATWPGFAYKGGSEPGVMNMTYWLLREDGEGFVLSVFANDTAKNFEQAPMVKVVERAIGMLSKE